MNQRHAEFFGPDLGRGPFSPHRLETAAVQIATALAQLRAPVSRADNDILSHGDFIRQLADRIAPDYAAYLDADVGEKSSSTITTTFRTAIQANSMIELWLADGYGGGVSSNAPNSVAIGIGTVMETLVANRHYRILSTGNGIISISVTYTGGTRTWYWGVSRHGRVYYSSGLYF